MQKTEDTEKKVYGELTLSVEEHSILSSQEGMFIPSKLPQDNMCRVIVDYKSTQDGNAHSSQNLYALKQQSPDQNYSKLIGLGAASLIQGGWLWGIGEIFSAEVPILNQQSKGAIAAIEINEKYSLVAFNITAESVDENTIWPFYTGDVGFRMFAFNRKGTKLEKQLVALKGLISSDAHLAVASWHQIYHDCDNRTSLTQICDDAVFCVLPDGPDYNEVSFQSSQYPVETLIHKLRDLASVYQISCLVTFNHQSR